MTRDALISALNHYRSEFQNARRVGNLKDARECGIIVARLSMDLEDVAPDTERQETDSALGYVRSRQLELDHIETLLRDDRPAGVRALSDWLAKIQRVDVPAKAVGG